MADALPDERWAPLRQAGSTGEQARILGRLVVRALKDAFADNLLHWAAAVSYYGVLSFAPLLLVIASIASFFVDTSWAVDQLTNILGDFVPEGEGQLEDLVNQAVSARGRIGALSFLALAFTGTRVFAALNRAVSIVYDIEESESFIRELLVQVAMFFTIGLVFVAALASGFLFGLISDAVGFLPSGQEGLAYRLVAGTVQLLMLLLAFFLIYRFVPRKKRDWQSALAGAGTAVLLFVVVRPLFLFYLENSSQQNAIYGSLATFVVLLIWVWIVSLIILFGAEIAVNTRETLIEGRPPEDIQTQLDGALPDQIT